MPLSSVLQAFKTKAPARKIRVGLIGAGRMGQFHARLLRRDAGADFVAIADRDTARAAALAKKYKTESCAQAADLIGRVEAVVIAVPTADHFTVGKMFLEAGVHCLIEKPLAATLAEAEELIRLADQ